MSAEITKVLVVTTGGTIEKSYCEEDGSISNRESQLKQRLLQKLRLPYTEIDVVEIMAKDSLHMNDDDRHQICEFIRERMHNGLPIVVLHGTDTMELTARWCFEKIPAPQVPVIFTGAMRPLGFEDSDGPQNFIEALMACKLAAPGFYISFHGHLFSAPHVTKNRLRGTFEATS